MYVRGEHNNNPISPYFLATMMMMMMMMMMMIFSLQI